MRRNSSPVWPVLTRYDQEHLARIALPLGGIGTGTVSLGGRGNLCDWEIMNRPAKGFIPGMTARGDGPFFCLYAKSAGEEAVARVLEGPLELEEYEGASGSPARNHGLPRFRNCSFAAAYPFGQVFLSDPDVPLRVRLEAFNPLVPGDADRSGVPVAILRYVLENRTGKTVSASVCGNLPNFMATKPNEPKLAEGRKKEKPNTFRRNRGLQGLFLQATHMGPLAETNGTVALATPPRAGISWRTTWPEYSWGNTLLDFWDDFIADGAVLNPRGKGNHRPNASLCVPVRIPPRGTRAITFFLAWHFPNRVSWTPLSKDAPAEEDIIGNYYATQYKDAWEVVAKVAESSKQLEEDTLCFVRSFVESDLPQPVKEAALNNLSTLRSQTCFRTPDGRFYGFEGCHDTAGCCLGSCTHVWNYEQATAFLFGELAQTMREVEFNHATDGQGLMSFRVHLPLSRAQKMARAAADGQMGCLMKLYRDWQLSGDDAFLEQLWPGAKRALEFCWIKGGWDCDEDGVMEGCQHNTMDVEYYGPNPQMGTWYLGALRAAEEMARYLGEVDFADKCHRLFENGSRWMDENLFNGDYYEHVIQPPKRRGQVAQGLQVGMGTKTLKHPILQLGAGCLVDQLVGQYMAHVCGLGYLLRPANVRKTLRSILKYNFLPDFTGHFNNMRSYVLGNESGLLMASYPKGRRPKQPFPYYNEVMTGFEHSTAVHMIYEGQTRSGLKCIEAIRSRYDGRKRNPFDEAECGHHYARAMASWAAVLALSGFSYRGIEKKMTFASAEGTHFWSTGRAWGTCLQKKSKSGIRIELIVLFGQLPLESLSISDAKDIQFPKDHLLKAGEKIETRIHCVP